MRALLIVGSLVTATLIPWDSLTVPGASLPSGSSDTQAGSASRNAPIAARLSPAFGIVPLPDGIEETQSGDPATPFQAPQTPADGNTGFGRRAGSRIEDYPIQAGSSGSPSAPPGVVCKDGVCTIPDRRLRESAAGCVPEPEPDDSGDTALASTARTDPAHLDLTWEQARKRLLQLGATHFQLEMDSESNQYRFRCRLPVKGQTNVGRQFEAWASNDMEAVIQTLAQVEAWRKARR